MATRDIHTRSVEPTKNIVVMLLFFIAMIPVLVPLECYRKVRGVIYG